MRRSLEKALLGAIGRGIVLVDIAVVVVVVVVSFGTVVGEKSGSREGT